jgi:energy-coupling factor transporter ATP-binding protein EcfA2
MTRTFDDRPAIREKTPLLVGLIGPSGCGKTFSALRLATGIQRVCGGDIYVVDTEARRALHYADHFKFRHLPFGAPFGPLDYLAAIEHCVRKGAGTIVVDGMSHEHEGPGGVLEMHEAELNRMAGQDRGKRERMTMLAWQKPKSERRRLINSLLQMNANFVFCFRAKEKIRIQRGAEPLPLGFQPIAGEEFVYELTLKCLLLPGASGTPTWTSDMQGEKLMMKLPEQFRDTFAKSPQLTEDIGQRLAAWAAGSDAAQMLPMTADELVASYAAVSDPATMRQLEAQREAAWKKMPATDKTRVKSAAEAAKERIERAAAAPPSTAAGDSPMTDEDKAAAEAAERESA